MRGILLSHKKGRKVFHLGYNMNEPGKQCAKTNVIWSHSYLESKTAKLTGPEIVVDRS